MSNYRFTRNSSSLIYHFCLELKRIALAEAISSDREAISIVNSCLLVLYSVVISVMGGLRILISSDLLHINDYINRFD
jgi:hypothetical protein